MVGSRIRLARQAKGLTIDQVIQLLADYFSISKTKAAISNYETDKTPANREMLFAFSSILGVPLSFFEEKDWEECSISYSQNFNEYPALHKAQLNAFVQVQLERILKVSNLLGETVETPPAAKTAVRAEDLDAIEKVCAMLRADWGIGVYAIHSVCAILEANNWIIFPLDRNFDFPEFSGIEHSRNVRFVCYKPTAFTDELRMFLMKELGRAYISYLPEEEDEVLSLFAREMLFPRQIAIKEFGSSVSSIREQDLSRIKSSYGIGRRQVMLRLHELGIADDSIYANFILSLNQNSFLLREESRSALAGFPEEPSSYRSKFSRAMSLGLIDQSEYNATIFPI